MIRWRCFICGEPMETREDYIPPVDMHDEPRPICGTCLDDDEQLSKVAGVPPWKGEH